MSRAAFVPLLFCLPLVVHATGASRSPKAAAHAFIDDLHAGRFAQADARFSKEIQSMLPTPRLEAVWKQMTSRLGAFEKVESTKVEAAGQYQRVLSTTRFAKSTVVLGVAVNDAGEVVGFHVLPARGKEKSGASATSWQPPAYAHPDRFVERKVKVGVSPELPGFITVPKGDGPFPAVVLIAGSGAENANETIGPNEVFEDLAWGLASRGIVVLRYDKRTLVQPEGVRTVQQEYLDGAHGAVQLLLHTPKVNPRRIFIVGHSEGGYLAPRIAKANPEVRGMAILEGNTRSLGDAIVDQLHYMLTLHPKSEKLKALAAESTKWRAQMQSPDLKPSDLVHLPLGGGANIPGSYILDLRGYHPAQLAAKLRKPVLVIQGGRDYQVTDVDFQSWKKALAGKPFARFERFPSLNHLMMPGTGKPNPSEYMRPGQHVSKKVVDAVASWIHGLKN